MKDDLKERLKKAIDQAEWSWLEPHQERGSIIIVSEELELAEVAFRIATDDQSMIAGWLKENQLTRPNSVQIDHWRSEAGLRLNGVIVQPFVLVQQIPS